MIPYVAFEGVEGAGKTTVCAATARRLRARRAVVTVREPGGTGVGEAIREILLHPDGVVAPWAEALLFAAARAQLAADVVRPALDRGAVVLSDRSVYSSLAYQGAGRGLGVEAVRAVNEPGLGGTWPSLVVLLRLDPEVGAAREDGRDRIGAEGAAFLHRVAGAFDDLAAAEPDRFLVVDADRPLDDVVAEVTRLLEGRC